MKSVFLRAIREGAIPVTIALSCLVIVGLLSCTKADPYIPPDIFYYYASYKVGKNPTTITTGDFNHDSFTDLITTNISSNTLSVLLGNGDGSFHDQTQIKVCQEPRALVMADFNHDANPDVVLACSGGDEIAFLMGRENGKFEEGPHYPVHRTPVALATDDLNGDRHPDIVVALRNDKLQVFLGTGTSEFAHGAQYQYGDTPTSVALSDLNGDGKSDMLVTNGGPMSNAVTIWQGNGDGTFKDPKDYPTGKRPLLVKLADFNNDHRSDLLVINGERDSFTTFLGNGNATFQPGQNSGADAGPISAVTRDFNGDHILDVAISNLQSNDISILFGKGDGTFHYPPRNYRTKAGPFALATFWVSTKEVEEPGLVTADNGDGTVSVYLHRGLKNLKPRPTASNEK